MEDNMGCSEIAFSLSNGGGDRADDVSQQLLETFQVVGDSPELSIHDGALHAVTSACHPAILGSPGYGLHLYRLTKLLSNHEAHRGICEGHEKVGNSGHGLPSLVSLAHKSLNTPGVLLGFVIGPGGDALDPPSLCILSNKTGKE